jgi:uncharacterized membrane protein YidH (DUF202 family)
MTSARIANWVLFLGLFGTAVAWTLQELLGYAVVSHACYPDWRPRYLPVVAGTWTITLAISILLTLAGVAALLVAWRSWQRVASPSEEEARYDLQVAEDRTRFMAFGGVVVGGMVMFAVVMNLLALFLLPVC